MDSFIEKLHTYLFEEFDSLKIVLHPSRLIEVSHLLAVKVKVLITIMPARTRAILRPLAIFVLHSTFLSDKEGPAAAILLLRSFVLPAFQNLPFLVRNLLQREFPKVRSN